MLLAAAHRNAFLEPGQEDLPTAFTGLRTDAFETADRRTRNQAVTVHAHKTLGKFLFQSRQRLLNQMFTFSRAYRHVFQFGAQIQDIADRDQMNPATFGGAESGSGRLLQLAQYPGPGR